MVDVPPPPLTLDDLFGEEDPREPPEPGPTSDQALPTGVEEAAVALGRVVGAPEAT